jgi:RNA polymerase sigma-70 factor (ECF subfamily)
MQKDIDTEIIRRIQRGESGLFPLVVRHYQGRLFSFLCSVLRNETDAEDICQEALFRAYQSIGSFRHGASFSTWLFAIAHNRARSHLAKAGREQPLDSISPASVDKTERTLEERELADEIDAALGELPSRQRTALHLFYREEIPYAEIAQLTGTPLNTVKSDILRGKDALRARLRGSSLIEGEV